MRWKGIKMSDAKVPVLKGETFLDKFQHPFVASFITSWIVCNWDIFYALIGGIRDPFATITEIKKQYPFFPNIVHLVILPLLGMGAYIYFGPRLLNWYLLYKHKGEVKRKFDEEVANGNMPITRTEYQTWQREQISTVRENEYLRAVNGTYRNKLLEVPGEGPIPLADIIKKYFELKEERKRLEDIIIKLKEEKISKK
jgi:hypothetical protein